MAYLHEWMEVVFQMEESHRLDRINQIMQYGTETLFQDY